MKQKLLLLAIVASALIPSAALATEYRRLSASLVWERWEWNGTDWCLSFQIPRGWRYAWVERTTDRSNRLWGHILSGGGFRQGTVWVDITAGSRARLFSGAGYRSIHEWKNEIYVWVYKN